MFQVVHQNILTAKAQAFVFPVSLDGIAWNSDNFYLMQHLSHKFPGRYMADLNASSDTCSKDAWYSKEVMIHAIEDDRYIICLPVKHIEDSCVSKQLVEASLDRIIELAAEMNITSFASVPFSVPLSALERDEWTITTPLMKQAFQDAPFTFTVCVRLSIFE